MAILPQWQSFLQWTLSNSWGPLSPRASTVGAEYQLNILSLIKKAQRGMYFLMKFNQDPETSKQNHGSFSP